MQEKFLAICMGEDNEQISLEPKAHVSCRGTMGENCTEVGWSQILEGIEFQKKRLYFVLLLIEYLIESLEAKE